MWLLEKRLREESPKWLKTAALVIAVLAALYVGGFRPLRSEGGIAQQRETGLAAVASRPMQFYQRGILGRLVSQGASVDEAIVGGVPAGSFEDKSVQVASLAEPASPPSPSMEPNNPDRKMVRTDSLDLVVQRPADAAEKISQLATRLGGFLVTSEVSGDPDVPSASLTIRVPAARFEEARTEIRNLGLRVESEHVEAQDVTRQYVDQQAHLRNLRAEEEQYLAILKHAATVSDTLEVSEKLGEVRGNIEQQQAEFEALSKQVETVAITVSLRAEADARVLGLNWRPLYRLKTAARNGLDSVGDYIGNMTALAFNLPAMLLWLATILAGAAIGWRILRWAGRVLFAKSRPAAANS
jgi:hypothetical protein